MAAPEKPWETRKRNLIPQQGALADQITRLPGGTPPSVPPRPGSSGIPAYNQNASGYSSAFGYGAGGGGSGGYYPRQYGTGFSSCSYPGTGYSYANGGGGYGGYRPYGSMNGNNPDPFVRHAEESTRSAFQSVESVVGAVGSIAMMLESTYFAVHSSFRALLGVAEHFSNLKNNIWQAVGAMQLLRRLQYWLMRLMALLRLREYQHSETVWEETLFSVSSSVHSSTTVSHPTSRQNAWPALMFFMVTFGIPFLMWKLLTLLSQSSPQSAPNWAHGDNPLVGRALYDFNSGKQDELRFSQGERLILAPTEEQPRVRGWVLAAKGDQIGLVPANYVDISRKNQSDGNKLPNLPLDVDQTD